MSKKESLDLLSDAFTFHTCISQSVKYSDKKHAIRGLRCGVEIKIWVSIS